jgi:hypothetical protein
MSRLPPLPWGGLPLLHAPLFPPPCPECCTLPLNAWHCVMAHSQSKMGTIRTNSAGLCATGGLNPSHRGLPFFCPCSGGWVRDFEAATSRLSYNDAAKSSGACAVLL